MSETALVKRESSYPDASQWQAIQTMADAAVKSGLFPALSSPQKAAMILLAGRDLGLSPTTAMRGVYVVNGKVALSADLMQAIVRRDIPGAVFEFGERTNEAVSLTVSRTGQKPMAFRFTIADATKAGLTAKAGPWQSYPRAMLTARVVSEACRVYFPDAASGLYIDGELPGDAREPIAAAVEIDAAPDGGGSEGGGRESKDSPVPETGTRLTASTTDPSASPLSLDIAISVFDQLSAKISEAESMQMLMDLSDSVKWSADHGEINDDEKALLRVGWKARQNELKTKK